MYSNSDQSVDAKGAAVTALDALHDAAAHLDPRDAYHVEDAVHHVSELIIGLNRALIAAEKRASTKAPESTGPHLHFQPSFK